MAVSPNPGLKMVLAGGPDRDGELGSEATKENGYDEGNVTGIVAGMVAGECVRSITLQEVADWNSA